MAAVRAGADEGKKGELALTDEPFEFAKINHASSLIDAELSEANHVRLDSLTAKPKRFGLNVSEHRES